jgi:hypothetical protein
MQISVKHKNRLPFAAIVVMAEVMRAQALVAFCSVQKVIGL